MSKVNLVEMDKIGQVFDRQGGYLKTGSRSSRATAPPRGFTGVLSFLEGHYQRCYDAGNTGMGNGVKIADKAATTIRANRAVYVETDRQAYEKLRKNNPSLPPYQEPKGQLPAGAKTPASGPSTAQRIWDGTKWVTKAVSDGAGQATRCRCPTRTDED